MIRIDCQEPFFNFTAAPCPAGIIKATLSRAHCAQHELPFVPVEGGFTVGPIPLDIRPGVWRLSFDTSCGCFMTSVHIDLCQAPAFTASRPDLTHETIIECCP